MSKDEDWWRGAFIYQIYPRSFLDTNNDGIGDLNGITQKLDYIADLGVDAIWISPFFKSPMKDFGYDVSDYRDVDPIFGTLEDFDKLLLQAHKRGLKIIIDLVLSHTSDQHPWFTDPTKKDWFVWDNGKTDKHGKHQPPNNWASVFGGSAWEWSKKHRQYYLHNFLKEQPDLNFHNKDVQDEMLNICRYWLDKGIDGLRLDVVNFYFHDLELRDNPPSKSADSYATQFEGQTPYSSQQHIYDKSRPENLAFIEKLRVLTDTYANRMLVGEIGDDQPYERAIEYTNGTNRLHTSYNPQLMSGTQKALTQKLIRTPIETFYTLSNESDESDIKSNSWPSWAFSNHDVVRASSRWMTLYEQEPGFSKMLIALLGCLPGTLFLYQGEELGLSEAKIPFESLQDPWAKETWPTWQGRDGCRTPIVWNDESPQCGFSNSAPWLPIPNTHKSLNIDAQTTNPHSCLNFTKAFIKWRKNRSEIIKGKHEFIDTNTDNIIHIRRYGDTNETNCIFNVSNKEITYKNKILHAYAFIIDGFINTQTIS